MARKKRSMEDDRLERVRSAGSPSDASAGDEGSDRAMSRTHRDDMRREKMHGDKLGADRSSDAMRSRERTRDEAVTEGNRQESQRGRRTEGRSNDERWDEAGEFTGKGNQREGSARPEGTGYTNGSNTEGSSGENPLV